MSGREIVVVAAVAVNGVIGREGDLPWRLPSDLAHFKATTMGLPMIMGRRTWASIGRPLPGRTTIVVSRDPGFTAAGAIVVGSLEAAFAEARRVAAASGAGAIAVVGGGEIYAQALPLADRLELTEVGLAPDLDGAVRFPPFAADDWVETARLVGVRGPRDEADFAFVTRRRRGVAQG